MNRPESRNYHVSPQQAQQTLVTLLRVWLRGESWSQVRKRIKARQVMVNGNLCLDEGRRLKAGDVVKVTTQSLPEPPRAEHVRIRYLDADLVVVEKPAGVTTMRHAEERFWPARRKQLQPTLDELLPKAIERSEAGRKVGKRGATKIRPVHRLDRDTSGLMVFARTVPAEQKLIRQFSKHTIHRAYLAIAHGRVEPQTIESYLVRDRGDGKRGSTANPEEGQRAVTHVRPLEDLGAYTLVECRLETGRTHQIRIHLSERGHMLCGEKMYLGPYGSRATIDRSGAPRVALHAAELGFTHPITGEELRFESSFPPDLAKFLKRLRQQASRSG